MGPRSQDPHVDEEALKILYRLRAEFRKRSDPPSSFLKAIESLIGEYEGQHPRPQGGSASRVSL